MQVLGSPPCPSPGIAECLTCQPNESPTVQGASSMAVEFNNQEMPLHHHAAAFRLRLDRINDQGSTPDLISQSTPTSESSTRPNSLSNLVDLWVNSETYHDQHHTVLSQNEGQDGNIHQGHESWASDSYTGRMRYIGCYPLHCGRMSNDTFKPLPSSQCGKGTQGRRCCKRVECSFTSSNNCSFLFFCYKRD